MTKLRSTCARNVEVLNRLAHEIEKGDDDCISLERAEMFLKFTSQAAKQAMMEFKYRKDSGYQDTEIDYYERRDDNGET